LVAEKVVAVVAQDDGLDAKCTCANCCMTAESSAGVVA
jgi:hypothetical protein